MLAYIKGIVAYKDAEQAVIEASGIGYGLYMSTRSLAELPATGNIAQVWTYLQVKEDGISLFGFSDQKEKQIFCQLISVSGIGPKIAISALSTFGPEELVACISSEDITAISKIPGIGKKTAQRVVLELQGALKTGSSLSAVPGQNNANMKEAIAALQSMGFTSEELSSALKGCDSTNTSEIIRYALKHVGASS